MKYKPRKRKTDKRKILLNFNKEKELNQLKQKDLTCAV